LQARCLIPSVQRTTPETPIKGSRHVRTTVIKKTINAPSKNQDQPSANLEKKPNTMGKAPTTTLSKSLPLKADAKVELNISKNKKYKVKNLEKNGQPKKTTKQIPKYQYLKPKSPACVQTDGKDNNKILMSKREQRINDKNMCQFCILLAIRAIIITPKFTLIDSNKIRERS